jgi:hypothetical protein
MLAWNSDHPPCKRIDAAETRPESPFFYYLYLDVDADINGKSKIIRFHVTRCDMRWSIE